MILILGAIDIEVSSLAAELDGKSIQFSNSKKLDKTIVRCCGIGNLAAAISLYKLKIEYPEISESLFLGSAGAYEENKSEFIFSNNFMQMDLAVAEGRGKKPDIMSSSINTKRGSLELFLSDRLSLSAGTVNSPDSITLVRTDKYPPHTYENLEAYGLAYVSDLLHIPFSCISPVTNNVGPAGSDEWRKNHRIMSETLQKNILTALDFK